MTLAVGERIDERCVESLRLGIARAKAEGARVLVLEGAADRFCLGMDFAGATAGDHRAQLTRFAALMLELATAPMPTLAVIDGPALGGGLGIACACDVILATDRARFGLPEALYGLAPAIIRPILLGRLSPARLRLLVTTCTSRDAHEGAALGLVDQLVPEGGLDVARARMVRQLKRAHPSTVAVLRRWTAETLELELAAGVDETAFALSRPDVIAALRSEDPSWI